MFRLHRLAGATLAFMLLSPLFATSAMADNPPVSLRPNAQEQLDLSPSSVTVALKEVAKLPVVIDVVDSSGKQVTDGPTEMTSTNLSVPLAFDLPRGTYTVTYRVESDKGPEGGSYQYSYGPGTFTITGVKTWNGYADMPASVQLKGDDERAKAAASSATETPPTATPTDGSGANQAGSDDASKNASHVGGWLWPTVAVIVFLAAGLAVFVRRASSDIQTDVVDL
ncbi:MAG: copper resistance protein CopC [Aeromicrobium sp.]